MCDTVRAHRIDGVAEKDMAPLVVKKIKELGGTSSRDGWEIHGRIVRVHSSAIEVEDTEGRWMVELPFCDYNSVVVMKTPTSSKLGIIIQCGAAFVSLWEN